MDNSTGMTNTMGRAGSLSCAAGVILFFLGIFAVFGIPRIAVGIGVGLMALSLVFFYMEERGRRQAANY